MANAMNLAYSLTSKSNAGLGNHKFVKKLRDNTTQSINRRIDRMKENTFAQRLQDPDIAKT